MSEPSTRAAGGYREEILGSLTPVRPLAKPSHRVWMLLPLGLLLASTAPLIGGGRGDLGAYAPVFSWGLTAVQSLVGIWLLALGFREAVPGHNVSARALLFAGAVTASLVIAVTLITNAISPTVVPPGREWQDWIECVVWPTALGAPFMVVATLMAVRAFPTRPAVAGALCGLAAGVLSDAGWRLTCWISSPTHIIESHGLAMLTLAGAGALLAVAADLPRWSRFRRL